MNPDQTVLVWRMVVVSLARMLKLPETATQLMDQVTQDENPTLQKWTQHSENGTGMHEEKERASQSHTTTPIFARSKDGRDDVVLNRARHRHMHIIKTKRLSTARDRFVRALDADYRCSHCRNPMLRVNKVGCEIRRNGKADEEKVFQYK